MEETEQTNARERGSSWTKYQLSKEHMLRERKYIIFACDAFEKTAKKIEDSNPDRFIYFPISWKKFPDGTDDITISGFRPKNQIAGEHVLFLASFHSNDVTLSQFSVLIVLLQSFIESLTIVLPFYSVGTMERVDFEGTVATANTYALLLSNLPSIGKPNRLMIYDIHALQERFYFHNTTIPSLHTSLPLLFEKLKSTNVSAVAFPDAGAAKRFGHAFQGFGFEIIICGKVRDGLKRRVYVQEGSPQGKNVVIVDDLVQTGGTLFECAVALRAQDAAEVNAFVAHAVFPNQGWKDFTRGGRKHIFEKFWLTNSQPNLTDLLPQDDVFEVLDLTPQILADLDSFGTF